MKSNWDAANALIEARNQGRFTDDSPDAPGTTFDIMFDASVVDSHLRCYHQHSLCRAESCEGQGGLLWHLRIAKKYLDAVSMSLDRHMKALGA